MDYQSSAFPDCQLHKMREITYFKFVVINYSFYVTVIWFDFKRILNNEVFKIIHYFK